MAYSNKGPQGDGGDQPKSKISSAPKTSSRPKARPKSVFEKFKDSISGPQTEKQKAASAAFHESMNKSEGDADQMAQDAMNQGIGSLGGAKSNATMYADNLKRYNDYMESQKQPPPTEITPDMRNAALSMFESQQGAGQVPYTMAAARNSTDPNMSPAFQYAAQNYDVLGGSQRLAPRPMEMMSVAERNRINDMSQAMADQAAPPMTRFADPRLYSSDPFSNKGGASTAPQPGGGQFNSLAELDAFQQQNPSMNLSSEYQRLKALQPPPQPQDGMGEGQQYEMFKQLMSGQGGKGNAPTQTQPTQSDFGRMLAARFGGGNQGGGGFGF